MITGKNKEQFEEWYGEFTTYGTIITFRLVPFEMQLGVYLAYYDSLDIPISIEYFDKYNYADEGFYFKVGKKSFYIDNVFDTRKEALKEALKEANKLRNQ